MPRSSRRAGAPGAGGGGEAHIELGRGRSLGVPGRVQESFVCVCVTGLNHQTLRRGAPAGCPVHTSHPPFSTAPNSGGRSVWAKLGGGTPSAMFTIRQYAFMYAALLGAMFAGSSAVHALLQPDLTLPAIPPPGPPLGGEPAAARAPTAPPPAAAAPPRQLA